MYDMPSKSIFEYMHTFGKININWKIVGFNPLN